MTSSVSQSRGLISALYLGFLLIGSPALLAQEPAPLLTKAIVRLTFDEESGAALDTATAGAGADNGTLNNDPDRVASPFWNQAGKRALQLSAEEQQYVEIAASPDTDRPDAATISLLCVNLLDPADAAYHGLFAKRGMQDGQVRTNYGINFTMQADTLQLYVSDGSGYQVVQYSTKAALPYRKLTHLTATFQVADAPGSDADADVDDVRVQLFANGRPLAPKSVSKGFVEGNAGWIVDQNIAGLVNTLPVSLGRSEASGEYFDGVIDEFTIFPVALSEAEALQLFYEVAGKNVDQLIKEDVPAAIPVPEITRLSQPGGQRGTTFKLLLVGKNFLPDPVLLCPAPGVSFAISEKPTAERIEATVTIAPDTLPAIYPVWVRTAQGLSTADAFAVDVLPDRPLNAVTAERPAELPGAYFGTLAGGQLAKAYFTGKQGQRIVADVELRRLGGKAQPVMELKSASGSPLHIVWGQSTLQGDARLEATLPADGLYYVELHDLAYRAPASSFRLKLGDLQFADLAFPLAMNTAHPLAAIQPVGTGTATAAALPIAGLQTQQPIAIVPFSGESGITGPWPLVRLSEGNEIVEGPRTDAAPQKIEVAASVQPLGISGRLVERDEVDRYLVTVTPGQALRFALQTRSLQSPLQGEMLLQATDGRRLAATTDQPLETDAAFDFTPPAGMNEVVVVVRNPFRTRDERNVYHVAITPGGRPNFALSFASPTLNIASDGTALLEVNVTRAGYPGPIALKLDGDAGVTIEPATVPQGFQGKLLCRVKRTAPPAAPSPLVRLIGTAAALNPPLERAATLPDGGISPLFAESLALGQLPECGIAVELVEPLAILHRGTTNTAKVRVLRQPGSAAVNQALRLSIRTTETQRRQQPNNPNSKLLPMVAAAPGLVVPPDQTEFDLSITVPTDVPESSLQLVVVAEAVAHAYSERVTAAAISMPVTVKLEAAVAPKLDEATLAIRSGGEHTITGKLNRVAGYAQPVAVSLTGLPANYQQTPARIGPKQDDFKIVITAPKVDAELALPNIKLRVVTRKTPLVADQVVNVKVLPPAQ